MKRPTLLFVIIAAAALNVFAQSFQNDAWLADFAELKREMSAHYANLEWAVAERGVNLKQLSEQTEARLREAKNEAEARAALDNFLRSFGDAHLYVDSSAKNDAADAPQSAQPLCARLGFEARAARPGIDFSVLDRFQPLQNGDAKYFPAGILKLSNDRKIGVIRIGLFMESMFPDLCETALSESKLSADAACDAACEDRINRTASNLLTMALARQTTALKREKIDALVIDLTANGGGTNWYEPAARTLSPKPLRSPRGAFIRHEHWAKNLQNRLSDFEAEIPKATGAQQKILKQAAEAARRDLAEANKACDRAGLWENQKPSCSLVVPFSNHRLPYAKPAELSNLNAADILFTASRYAYQEGVYDGKLLILIDGRTASSSEAFTAMLRDSNAATVVGTPSMGAGCGYTNGGIPTVLKNSRLKIKMPDCVRLRADGSNEVNGITPDIIVPWRTNDSPFQRAKRVVETLEKP
jgi:hypothetical protein